MRAQSSDECLVPVVKVDNGNAMAIPVVGQEGCLLDEQVVEAPPDQAGAGEQAMRVERPWRAGDERLRVGDPGPGGGAGAVGANLEWEKAELAGVLHHRHPDVVANLAYDIHERPREERAAERALAQVTGPEQPLLRIDLLRRQDRDLHGERVGAGAGPRCG